MDQFGQNQFAPGMKSSLFVPDQLVVSTLQLVTDSELLPAVLFCAVLFSAKSPLVANTRKV